MDNFNILFYLRIINKHKNKLFFLVAVTVFFTMITGFRQPRLYTSRVTFLLTGEKGAASNIGSLLGIQNLSIGETNNLIIDAMIQSRRMAEGIARHFKLQERYHLSSFEQAVGMARGMVRPYNISAGMAIEGKSSDPILAADAANFAVEYLDILNSELNITAVKPMVKILDRALPPSDPASRQIIRKMLASSILMFVGGTVLIFFYEYLIQLDKSK